MSPPNKHMLSLLDYSAEEITTLIESSLKFKVDCKVNGQSYAKGLPLQGKVVALMFSKKSTRTRVASETAITYLGGHPMFIGASDIHLGVNEPLRDTSQVISSMVDCIIARVGVHEEIEEIAKYSSVPVVNALSEDFHPTQILADLMTIYEEFSTKGQSISEALKGLLVSWVGDTNNMLFEIITTFPKFGINLKIATPKEYPIPERLLKAGLEFAAQSGSFIQTGTDPVEAIKDSNIVITDTWISMGHELETKERLKQFQGYQVSSSLIEQGKPAPNWKFMHCLPRKKYEVTDEIFYSERSIAFQEAENRKWTLIATLDELLVKHPKKSL